MNVFDLLEVLAKVALEYPDADIGIAQSQEDWESVLFYTPDPANSDSVQEIRL